MAAAFVAQAPSPELFSVAAGPLDRSESLDGFADALYEELRETLGSECSARSVTSEVMTRVTDHPLWEISLRHGLPLGPLVRDCAEEVLAEHDFEDFARAA